jgi:uncharacterized protein YdaU (DUF1376 family)
MTLEEEGMYNRLMDYCWLEKSIPKDPKILAALCKGATPTALVLSCFTDLNGVLIHKRLDLERQKHDEYRKERSLSGQKGNEKRWGKRKRNKKLIANGSLSDNSAIAEPSQKIALQSSSSFASSFASASPTATAIKSIAASQAPPPGNGKTFRQPADRPKDEAYELFALAFREKRKTPYRMRNGKEGDFVQLANLRKQLLIGTRETPDKWEIALENYLSSPLTTYTLADLCVRYDVFVLGEVDRYGRPAGFNDVHQANKSTVKSLQEKGFFDE